MVALLLTRVYGKGGHYRIRHTDSHGETKWTEHHHYRVGMRAGKKANPVKVMEIIN